MQILLLKVNINFGKMLNETTNPPKGRGLGVSRFREIFLIVMQTQTNTQTQTNKLDNEYRIKTDSI
jgi:hypothetical protein